MILREASGNFPFSFWIEKANIGTDLDKMVIEGVASTSNVDHDGERMSAEALKAMVDVVNKQGVPLRLEHDQRPEAIVGSINKGWLDDRGAFHIQAELDPSHIAAPLLYRNIKNGENYGLSVGGFVKRAIEEMVEGVGREVKTFYDILLDEVSVTKHPSNYDAVGLKAVKSRSKEGTDFLQAFAKSIPADEWKEGKDYQLAIKYMNKKDIKKGEEDTTEETHKHSEDTEETTKSVSKQEFNELAKMVSVGFNSMTDMLGKMAKAIVQKEGISVEAKDQVQPDKEKMDDPDGDKDVQKADTAAVDQRQPDKKKEDAEDTPEKDVKKDAQRPTSQEEANGSDENGEREKSSTKKGKDDDDTYDLTTVQRAIKRIEAVKKEMDTDETEEKKKSAEETDEEKPEKKSKAADSEKDSETVTKSRTITDIDQFAVTVAETIERMEKSLKDQGFQTQHVAKAIVEQIRSNPEYQADIKEMMRQPGKKRSVIMGTPFVKMRGGQMFKLTAEEHPSEKVEKSENGKTVSFKAMWGKSYASVSNEE